MNTQKDNKSHRREDANTSAYWFAKQYIAICTVNNCNIKLLHKYKHILKYLSIKSRIIDLWILSPVYIMHVWPDRWKRYGPYSCVSIYSVSDR